MWSVHITGLPAAAAAAAAASGGDGVSQVVEFDHANATLLELKTRLQLERGDFIFAGGKRLNQNEQRIPFDSQTNKAKCRVLGAVPSHREVKPFIPPPAPISSTATMPPPSATATAGLLIKGPNKETHIEDLSAIHTYLDLKEHLVKLGVISNPKAVRLIGKGGKTPLDGDAVKVEQGELLTIRAMLTEYAVEEREAKARKLDLAQRLDRAELAYKRLVHGLVDKQVALFETRALESELQVILQELGGDDARTKALLNQVSKQLSHC